MLNHRLKPMLLHNSPVVPIGEYIHQIKFDGHRALLHFQQGDVKVFTRNQNECTSQYPELEDVGINAESVILDGEMIVLDEKGVPCFESVMERFHASKQNSIMRVMNSKPAHFVAFDVLYINGESVMNLPLEKRLELLEQIVLANNVVSVAQTFSDGNGLFQAVCEKSLEGIVSKKKGSKYVLNERSPNWLKIKNYQLDTVYIAGIRKKQFGWSLLKEGQYVGMMELVPPDARIAFKQIARKIVQKEDTEWLHLEPLIKCEVKYQSLTKKGLMRSPSFIKFVY